MPNAYSFESFFAEICRLVTLFEKKTQQRETERYDEQSLRNDFLTPFWRTLGWDTENREGLPQQLREVEIETRVEIGGKKKRADYILRTHGVSKLICEAKKPKEELSGKDAYQAQRYAFNLGLFPATLSNFQSLQLFFVGGKPDQHNPFPVFKQWHYSEYPARARELWDLFARENIAAGSLDRIVATLRKKPLPGKARQGWVWIPERVRTVDDEFLAFIEDQRVILARDLLAQNKKFEWSDVTLNECIQRILDRVLFVRICEDRDIDTGRTLQEIVDDWRHIAVNRPTLYSVLVSHFNTLDVSFNGALFRSDHVSEQINVSDQFLCDLIQDLSSEDSPYLFSTLPIEILGSVYERFIGKTVGVTKGGRFRLPEYKNDLRRSEGVYYTPRYIVDYIVDRAVTPLISDKSPKRLSDFRVLDSACGSGSFLIRVFERICEHYVRSFQGRKSRNTELCYLDAQGNVHLTTHLKRQIMLNHIYGVDVDPQAVEVTMLSLYLKILEGETRTTLGQQRTLFPRETFLPDLSNNIKLGNTLISREYFDLFSEADEWTRVRPFDWEEEFRDAIEDGGFSAIVGNPLTCPPFLVQG